VEVSIDDFEEIVLNCILTGLQLIQHPVEGDKVVFSIGGHFGQRDAVGDGHRFILRQMPL
jgi:hypothetical protein